jgi:periplasmic nitrate reductase NapE
MNFARPDASEAADRGARTRARELLVFAVLAVLVWPVVAVGVVGGYGFAVWMYQHIAGPPGPPRH